MVYQPYAVTVDSGGLTTINIPFDYLDYNFLKLKRNGTLLTEGVDYRRLSKTVIEFITPNVNGDYILLERRTSSTPVTSFDFGNILQPSNLGLQQTQVFHIIEESLDIVGRTLALNSLNVFDAEGIRISNLGLGLLDTDAATYGQLLAVFNAYAETALMAETWAETASINSELSVSSAANAATATANAQEVVAQVQTLYATIAELGLEITDDIAAAQVVLSDLRELNTVTIAPYGRQTVDGGRRIIAYVDDNGIEHSLKFDEVDANLDLIEADIIALQADVSNLQAITGNDTVTIAPFSFNTIDANRRIIAYTDDTGRQVNVADSTPDINGLVHIHYADLYAYTILHVLMYGQSLSRGNSSEPALTLSQKFNNLMFSPGVHNDAGFFRTTFVPMIENDTQVLKQGETPLSGLSEFFCMMAFNQGYTNLVLLLSSVGQGGQPISELNDNTAYYERQYLNEVYNAVYTANNQGDTICVVSENMVQGEDDHSLNTGKDVWLEAFIKGVNERAVDVAKATGQKFRRIVPIAQISNFKKYTDTRTNPFVALAQLEAAAKHPDIYIACPTYMLERAANSTVTGAPSYPTDYIHLSAKGSKVMGCYLGLLNFRVIILREHWKPMMVERVEFLPNETKLYVHVPYGQLTEDSTTVTPVANKGIDLWDASGNLWNSNITGTVTHSGNVITIPHAGTTVPVGGKVTLGFEGADTTDDKDGRVYGGRIQYRDTQGDLLKVTIDGETIRLDNWMLISEHYNKGV